MQIQDPRPLPDYAVISASGSVLIKNSPGKLIRILYTSTQTFTAIVYDGLDATTGVIIASFDIAQADKLVGEWNFGTGFNTGLFIVCTGTPPLTIIFD